MNDPWEGALLLYGFFVNLGDMDGHAVGGGELLGTVGAAEVFGTLMLDEDFLVIEGACAVPVSPSIRS